MPASDGPGFCSPAYLCSEHEMLSAPSPTRLSETGLLRRRFKGHRSSKKSLHAYSDYGEAGDTDGGAAESPSAGPTVMGPRSISLTALHPATAARSGRISAGGAPLLEPRMAQLETLEAKMASIEVSLSSSSLPGSGVRRPKRSLAPPASLLSRVSSPTILNRSSPSSPVPPSPSPAPPSNRDAASAARELEALRNALKDKENVIHSLKAQLSATWRPGPLLQPSHVLSDKERRATEEKISKVRQEMETKLLAIKNLKMSLERLDITDNIDVRIQQAEAEFQLGREELALLGLTEECRTLTARLEETNSTAVHHNNMPVCSLHSLVTAAVPSPQKSQGILLAVNVPLDPANPVFGIARRSDNGGSVYAPLIEWAADDSGLQCGDRILEANGKLLLGYHAEEISSILTSACSTLGLVILRVGAISKVHLKPPDTAALILKEATALREELAAARGRLAQQSPESEKVKKERDTLKAENLRLSHRISYLEEQVSDLVKDTASISSQSSSLVSKSNGPPPEVHVFQKGTHVTTIVTNLQDSARLTRRPEPPPVSRSQTPRWHPGDESEGGCSDGRSTRSLDVLLRQRPAPPKKPQRLSLPRAASLQQVDGGVVLGEAPRKPSKRSHKGSSISEAALHHAKCDSAALRWSNAAPSCVLPANAQYHNHNQHLLNFRRSNMSVAGEKWC